MNNIFEPITLSRGSHQAGSGRGCAMNVISWESGEKTITDYPECSDRMLSRLVQGVNDDLADSDGYLSPANSIIALDLGHATVGTSGHGLSDVDLQRVYVRCAVLAARKVLHLAKTPKAKLAIEAAEAWAENPTAENKAAAYAAADAAYAAADAAAAYAAADAAYAAADAAYAAADAAYAYAAADAAYAGKSRIEFKIELVWEIIALFKSLTGTDAKPIAPEVTACAVEKMLAKV